MVPIRVEPQVFVDILAPNPRGFFLRRLLVVWFYAVVKQLLCSLAAKVFLRYLHFRCNPRRPLPQLEQRGLSRCGMQRNLFIWKLALPVFLRPFACNCPDLACRVILVGHPCEKAWHAEASSWLKLQKETSKVSKRSSLYFWHSPPNYLCIMRDVGFQNQTHFAQWKTNFSFCLWWGFSFCTDIHHQRDPPSRRSTTKHERSQHRKASHTSERKSKAAGTQTVTTPQSVPHKRAQRQSGRHTSGHNTAKRPTQASAKAKPQHRKASHTSERKGKAAGTQAVTTPQSVPHKRAQKQSGRHTNGHNTAKRPTQASAKAKRQAHKRSQHRKASHTSERKGKAAGTQAVTTTQSVPHKRAQKQSGRHTRAKKENHPQGGPPPKRYTLKQKIHHQRGTPSRSSTLKEIHPQRGTTSRRSTI